jgi:hypothetical protein
MTQVTQEMLDEMVASFMNGMLGQIDKNFSF